MRRTFLFLSLALLVAGLELAAGTFSSSIDEVIRVVEGWVEYGSPDRAAAPFVLGIVLFLLGVFGLAANFWGRTQQRRLLRRGTRCPKCGSGTRRVPRKWRHRLIAVLTEERVSRRRCGDCGWTGLAARDR